MPRIKVANVRRREIIDSAIAVLAREGWAGASIDEITREAGVSRGLVSYHFRDKSELLAGVLERCRESFTEAMAEASAGASDPAESLRLTTHRALAFASEQPGTYRVFLLFIANAETDPVLNQQTQAMYASFRRGVAAAIRAGQHRGLFRRDINVEAAAARHIGAVTGLALQHLLDPAGFPFEEASHQAEEMLSAYLQPGTVVGDGYELAAASGA